MPKPRSEALKKRALESAKKLDLKDDRIARFFEFGNLGDYTQQEYEPEDILPIQKEPSVLKKAAQLMPRYEGIDVNPESIGILGRLGPARLKAGIFPNFRQPKESVLGVKGRINF